MSRQFLQKSNELEIKKKKELYNPCNHSKKITSHQCRVDQVKIKRDQLFSKRVKELK